MILEKVFIKHFPYANLNRLQGFISNPSQSIPHGKNTKCSNCLTIKPRIPVKFRGRELEILTDEQDPGIRERILKMQKLLLSDKNKKLNLLTRHFNKVC